MRHSLCFNPINPEEGTIETRELIAWILAAGGAGLALLFLFFFGARTRALSRELAAAAGAAARDATTGVWNRRSILGTLEAEVARCLRGDDSLGLLLIDIDDFPAHRTALGRDSDDAILQEVASRIGRNVRIYDSVGRYEGEAFLVVLPDSDEQELNNIAERIRMMVDRSPVVWHGQRTRITVSIGGVTTLSLDEKSSDRMVRMTVQTLAEARSFGGNRVVINEPFELTEESSLGLPLETQQMRINREEDA